MFWDLLKFIDTLAEKNSREKNKYNISENAVSFILYLTSVNVVVSKFI